MSLSYMGRVERNTLTSLVVGNPYVSSFATIRHSDIPLDVAAAVETDWNATWRTRFGVRVRNLVEYPLLDEGALAGTWLADYRGTTRVNSFEADLFAKFDANSYFSVSAELLTSKNSLTQERAPYLPGFRLSGGAWFELLPGLGVHPTVVYVGPRRVGLTRAGEVAGFFTSGISAEYEILSRLSATIDCQNILNARYEEWRGYRATPFTLTAGLRFRW
jgi:outer membrane receptor protein involved in Fe transport